MQLVTTTLVVLSPEERALMRARRHTMRLSIKRLARLAECSPSALLSWETGDRRPALSSFNHWQIALGGLDNIGLSAGCQDN